MCSESEAEGQLHRRRFLKVISGGGAAVTGLAVGVPTLTAFVASASQTFRDELDQGRR